VKTFFGDKNTTGRITGDSFGRLVVRPDSGDPADTCKVCRVNFLKKHMPKIEKFWKKILKLMSLPLCPEVSLFEGYFLYLIDA